MLKTSWNCTWYILIHLDTYGTCNEDDSDARGGRYSIWGRVPFIGVASTAHLVNYVHSLEKNKSSRDLSEHSLGTWTILDMNLLSFSFRTLMQSTYMAQICSQPKFENKAVSFGEAQKRAGKRTLNHTSSSGTLCYVALPSLDCFGPKLLTPLSRCRALVHLSAC